MRSRGPQTIASTRIRRLLGAIAAATALLPLAADPAVARPGTHRALLIGINDYAALPTLRGAINDVETMQSLLTTRYGFLEENVRVVTNEQATRAGILEALEQLVRDSGPDDFVYIHYSGHGSQVRDTNGDEEDGRDETICPQDARTEGIADITDDELDALASRFDVSGLVFTLDSCHSGTALRDAQLQIRPRLVELDERDALYSTRTRAVVALPFSERYVLFTGAASNEAALDGPFAPGRYHGLFSYAFSQALEKAPADASPRDLMLRVEQELQQVRPRLGGRTLPEPQLEGPTASLDRPLLPTEAGTSPPRLAFAEVEVVEAPRARLLDGARIGALPGSIWSVYPAGDTAFAPGAAQASILIDGRAGSDALGRILEDDASVEPGSRAVRSILPPPSAQRTTVLLRQVKEPLHTQLADRLRKQLAKLVDIVEPGDFASFIVDCDDAEPATCTVLDAQGAMTIATLSGNAKQKANQLTAVVARWLVVGSLLAIDNPASEMILELRPAGARPRQAEGTSPASARLAATLAPHRLRFYQPGEERTEANTLQLEVRTDRECFLTVAAVDSKGTIRQLFPNSLQRKDFLPGGRIPADATIRIPDSTVIRNAAGFHLDYGPPAGEDVIRAFCNTAIDDATLLRQRIGAMASGTDPRTMIDSLDAIGQALSTVSTRGVVVTASDPETTTAPKADDWTTASLTLRVSE